MGRHWKAVLAVWALCVWGVVALAAEDEGVISVRSAHDVRTTMDRLESAVRAAGLNVFDRIDHAAGAAKVGLTLRPTQLLIFGNPKVGTRLMHCSQRAALDLPMKALVWEDANGHVWLSYNDPAYLAARHHAQGCNTVVEKMQRALYRLAAEATGG